MTTTTTILAGTIDLGDLHGTTLDTGRRYDVDQLDLRGFRLGDGSRVDHVQGLHYADWFRDGEYLGPDCDGVEPVFAADSVRRSMPHVTAARFAATLGLDYATSLVADRDWVRDDSPLGEKLVAWSEQMGYRMSMSDAVAVLRRCIDERG